MKTIFILEDHRDTREMLISVAREAFPEADIISTENLADARARIVGLRVSLALVDLNLPDGSGIEFIRELAAMQDDCYTVVATIYDDDKHLFAALRAGAQGYLLKEERSSNLVSALKAIIKGQPPLSPAIARRILRQFNDRSESVENVPSARSAVELPPDDPLGEEALTQRETEVLRLVAKGCSRSEVAEYLGITANTAASHVKNIYRKLNISSRAEAAIEARRRQLT